MRLDCGCPNDFPDWHDHDINLGGQLIHFVSAPMFIHMPISYELHVERQQQILGRLELEECWPGLALMRTALFRGRIIRLLRPAVSPAKGLEYLPEPFYIRGFLHQGTIDTITASIRQVQTALVRAGRRPKELYLGHLTCPQCSKPRGGEKILLLRHWVESPSLLNRIQSRLWQKGTQRLGATEGRENSKTVA